ncbi:MAG: 30S ribosomal protein S8e [Candidatus Aenigmarchaeota archaeon]|nr:30S ribosomal protein S8e [Candidatus Aenigmarchaeota archaeon]
MPKWHIDVGRKVTGGVVRRGRKKKKYEMGGDQILVKVSEEEKRKVVRTKGGGRKVKAVEVAFANVTDPKTGKTKKVKILGVVKNPANPHYVRRAIVTKGSIIKTEMGEAKVTSRPTQDGVVNAVLIVKQ